MANMQNFPQLTENTNFNNWMFRINILLEERNVAQILKEEETHENFERLDTKARSIIVQCLSDKYLEVVKKAKTAKEMIKALKDTLERKSVFNKLYLKKKLLSLKCDSKQELQEHLLKFDSIVNEVEASGSKMDEIDKVCHLLLTLPEEYDQVITALETLTTEDGKINMEFVKSRLLDAEIKIREKSKDNSNTETSFSSQHFPFNCYICGKKGHKATDCMKRTDRTEHNRGRGCYTQRSKRGNNFRRRGGYRQAHSANIEVTREAEDITFIAFNTEVMEEEENIITFIIDSGATENLVKEELTKYMYEVTDLNKSVNIKVANGEILAAKKRGKLKLLYNETMITINALIVPKLTINLLSVKKVMENSNFKVNFSNKGVKIYKGNFTIYGEMKENLYVLKFKQVKEQAGIAETKTDEDLWHKRLGHLNRRGLTILKLPSSDKVCEPCMKGKATRLHFKSQQLPRTNQIGELLHSDVAGPIRTPTKAGERYYQTVIDDYTHFCVVYLLKNKSEVTENLKNYIRNLETQKDIKVKRIRCDNGGEYKSKELKEFCRMKGISIEYTQPYSPQQNGVSERMNRTLQERTRTLLAETNLPKQLWGEAIQCATYQLNRSPTSTLYNDIPARRFYGKIDLSNLRIFGSKAWAVIIPQTDKLNVRAKSMRMIGYGKNGYRLWCPETNNIIVSRDVRFDEKDCRYEERGTMESENFKSDYEDEEENTNKVPNVEKKNEKVQEEDVENSEDNQNVTNTTRSGRTIRTPNTLSDFELYTAYCLCMSEGDPETYTEAINKDEKWKIAIEEELKAHRKMNTWTFTELPEGQHTIEARWIFRTKENDIKKARLVAKGFQLQEENNFSNNYAPVARMTTVRLFLTQATVKSWQIKQLDIPTAFLNGELDIDVFMKIPEGIQHEENKVMKLNKGLYGLRQSPKCWNIRFDDFMRKIGMTRSKHDFCVYIGQQVWLLVFVDDILVTGNEENIKRVISEMKKEFNAKELGNIKNFLGMQIERSKEYLKITQEKYIKRLLNKYNMSECNGTQTPMIKDFQVTLNEPNLKVPYRELIGSLMFLSMISRPDITYAMTYLSQFLNTPTNSAWTQAKRILRYLKETQELGLNYKRQSEQISLETYSDADWGASKVDRKSVSGSVTYYCGNPVSWFSRKQPCVALSTAEAEYVAAATSASELMNIQGLCSDFGDDLQATLYVDNKGAINLSESYENSKRAKHIDIKFHFIKDLVAKQILSIKYIQSKLNIADVLTKSLSRDLFVEMRNQLCIY